MQQTDIKTPVRRIGSEGDGRVTCETLFKESSPTSPDLNFPPESYFLSIEDENDWFDRNVFLDRKESHKGISITNRISHSRSVPNNSQRLSGNLKKSRPSIIGLPQPQTNTFHDCKTRRHSKPGNTRFFPKRLGSAAKFSLRLNEPSSPKVSCMGKVRSNRCRRSRDKSTPRPKKTGLWSSFKKLFSFGCRNNHAVNVDDPLEDPKKMKEDCDRGSVDGEGQVNPPGLAGMNRFVSGRRSSSWAGDVGDLELHGSPKAV